MHLYEDRERRSAVANMATDEALLEVAAVPSLRIYGWARPSLSFGYFGSFSEIENEMERREVVRRWTGGGIVFHGEDLTYALILPGNGSEPLPHPREIYSRVHEAIRRALAPHLAVELAARDAPKISAACFANPVIADVMADGKKIAGAAQRRTRRGLLHQGSIQLPHLPASFAEKFARELFGDFSHEELSPKIHARAEALAHAKYGSEDWLRRH